jgi:hypothetical protein
MGERRFLPPIVIHAAPCGPAAVKLAGDQSLLEVCVRRVFGDVANRLGWPDAIGTWWFAGEQLAKTDVTDVGIPMWGEQPARFVHPGTQYRIVGIKSHDLAPPVFRLPGLHPRVFIVLAVFLAYLRNVKKTNAAEAGMTPCGSAVRFR